MAEARARAVGRPAERVRTAAEAIADAEAMLAALESSLLHQHGTTAGQVGMDEISHIFRAMTAVAAAEELASGAASVDGSREGASPLPWWCDCAGDGCVRPTEPTSLDEYAAEHRCWTVPSSTYMVCEVCFRAGRAAPDQVPLEEMDLTPAEAADDVEGAEEQETRLIEALMDADRLHDAGYESSAHFELVGEQVYAAKADVFIFLRTRLDSVQMRVG